MVKLNTELVELDALYAIISYEALSMKFEKMRLYGLK